MDAPDTQRRGVSANLSSGAPSTQLMKYYGGPLIRTPRVKLIFLGRYDPGLAQSLSDYVAKLLVSPFMNLLGQYGIGPGEVVGRAMVPDARTSITDAELHTLVYQHRDRAANCYALSLAGMGVDDGSTKLCEPSGDNAFGYHGAFTHRLKYYYYSVVPGLEDACLKASCSSDAGCSVRLTTPVPDRIRQVCSHELAEMFTDPIPGASWTSQEVGEVGDPCNGATQNLPGVGLAQIIFSRYDALRGRAACQPFSPSRLSNQMSLYERFQQIFFGIRYVGQALIGEMLNLD